MNESNWKESLRANQLDTNKTSTLYGYPLNEKGVVNYLGRKLDSNMQFKNLQGLPYFLMSENITKHFKQNELENFFNRIDTGSLTIAEVLGIAAVLKKIAQLPFRDSSMEQLKHDCILMNKSQLDETLDFLNQKLKDFEQNNDSRS